MADNPLLPQARLRELHALMKRCRDLDRKSRTALPAREGWLAASATQLEAGDLLCTEPGDGVQSALRPASLAGKQGGKPADFPSGVRLAACGGVAHGFKAAGNTGLVLAYARAGALEPGWADVLSWAQRDQLPFLLACAEVRAAGRKRAGEVLTWESLTRVAQRCGLPVFPVDAEDAVAVYRVMYEAVLRARGGGGPAVLWGLFSSRSRTAVPRASQPLSRLETYLRVRGIKLST